MIVQSRSFVKPYALGEQAVIHSLYMQIQFQSQYRLLRGLFFLVNVQENCSIDKHGSLMELNRY
ncbi:hypothetical protein BLOT_014654 [Blomia tropicalis]|nr:hypothetical protein BLOT_014654 [Blomia tropicalis]